MIRSAEAVIASVLMLGTVIYLFNVPKTQSNDPIEQYIRSILDSYSDVAKLLGTKDPYTLKLLLDASMPNGYDQRIVINYFKNIISYTGIGSAPNEFYFLLPAQGTSSLPNSEMKSNWFRSVFRIKNSSPEIIKGEKSISASLYKPILIEGGTNLPIDLDSVIVFTDDEKLNSTLTTYEDYYDHTIVGLIVTLDIDAGETKNLYVYYLVGDDYE